MEVLRRLPADLPPGHTSTGQDRMPLLEALLAWERTGLLSFHTPGHRQGRELWPDLRKLLPHRLFSLDATELPDLDDLHRPRGAIARAQQLLAELYGADESFLLVGGSTSGILAAVLATCGPGGQLLMARHSHRAAFAAAVFAGCRVRYVGEEWGGDGTPRGPSLTEIERLVKVWSPHALLLTRPNYYGIGFPLERVAAACAEAGAVLVVDEAHAPHWAAAGLPCGLSAGADVVIQSAHKTLPALTQAAWLHLRGSRVDPGRLRASLRMVQSASPSFLLMASLDAARWHLGRWLPRAAEFVRRAREVRQELLRAGVALLPRDLPAGWVQDPFRLLLDTAAAGADGREVARWLAQEGIEVEWAEPDRVLILLGLRPGEDADVLVRTVTRLLGQRKPRGREARSASAAVPGPGNGRAPCPYPRLEAVLDPATAWWAEWEPVPVEQAAGRVAAEMVYLSPPGVPVVAPGEKWSQEAVQFVRWCREAGLDPGGQDAGTVRVVREAGRERG